MHLSHDKQRDSGNSSLLMGKRCQFCPQGPAACSPELRLRHPRDHGEGLTDYTLDPPRGLSAFLSKLWEADVC